MKKLFLFLFLLFASANIYAAESKCNVDNVDDKLALSNCVEYQSSSNIFYRIGSKVISKLNFTRVADAFSPIVDIDTESYPDNSKKNAVIVEPILYIVSIALLIFAVYAGWIYIRGLINSSSSGEVRSMKNLYMPVWLFGGGYVTINTFMDLGQMLAACGLIIAMLFWAYLQAALSYIFGWGDLKTVQNEILVQSEYVASQLIDGETQIFINDIRNRKRLIMNKSVSVDTYGYKLEDWEYIKCFSDENISGSSVFNTDLIPKSVLNSAYCARTVGNYDNYTMGKLEDKIQVGNTGAVLTEIESMESSIRGFAAKVERNNCAIAYQSVKNLDIKMFVSCMDMEDSGQLKLKENDYLTVVSDQPIAKEAMMADRKVLTDTLAKKLYDLAIEDASEVQKPADNRSDLPGITSFVGSQNEYTKAYRAAAMNVLNAVSVNNDVSVSRGFLTSMITSNKNRNDFELGRNNDYGVLDYSSVLNETDSKITLFRTVNAVSGGMASSIGFNYEDCFNSKSCATTSTNILGVISDAAYSVIVPSFTVYLGAAIWEGIAKGEDAKLVNTNKKIASTATPAKKIKDIAFVATIVVAFFYLAFNYELYGRQILRVFDWLLMTVVSSFVMIFVVLAFIIDVYEKKKVDPNYFSLIREAGLFDIVFRPVVLSIWMVSLLIVSYIVMAINSILIRLHLEGYISFYGTTGVVADIVSLIIFSSFYAILMIVTAHITIKEIDKTLSNESEALFTGLSNSLEAADSVFAKMKSLQYSR